MASRRILKIMRLAKQGDAQAQLDLGQCYIHGGEGLAANLSAAYRWLAAAADQGEERAAWLIGEQVPSSVVDSPQRARVYYEIAERQGSVTASAALAEWRLAGALGPIGEDERSAIKDRLRAAAVAGNLQAQLRLGEMAARGEADAADLVWLQRAAERGERRAAELLVDHYWQLAGGGFWRNGDVPGGGAPRRTPEQRAAAHQALVWHLAAWRNRDTDMPPEEAWRRGCLLLLDRNRGAGAWLERAAREGHAKAAYLLGLMYMGPSYVNGI